MYGGNNFTQIQREIQTRASSASSAWSYPLKSFYQRDRVSSVRQVQELKENQDDVMTIGQ